MKRIGLFLLTNLAVIVVLMIVWFVLSSVFGLGRTMDYQAGTINLTSTLVLAAVFGFGGSLISLLISKWMAKKSVGAQVIETPRNESERWLVETVQRQAREAGIGMPEVAIYDSPEINAFATGASRNKALVAVSTGLLSSMTRDEAEAVLGHEVGHIANGDMITLTLIQGVVNTFVIFFARIVGFFVDRVLLKNEEGPGIGFFVTTIVAEIVFGILASTIVMWFSRQREFRADDAGARFAGREKMIAALERLKVNYDRPSDMPAQMTAFGIFGRTGNFGRLFMSHPPLDERIAALRAAAGHARTA
ncbi:MULTISPECIES: protease HtpX [unclassified Guyparkeria]|uniref:protease HtpX n=1 Tax=unclassified Guyparkeria TaxID=2626246 RepID=UPI0007335BA6|nr:MULTISPECIES: protease HtpX [unclassified Guyparkeria]KTG16052.1 protease HtpX [Guyparkeria sp. XI15]OAE84903.1 zinc metalloprotease HtpX [Guyparkeria sp. WRN-7]